MIDTDDLRAKALAATPGPWHARAPGDGLSLLDVLTNTPDDGLWTVARCNSLRDEARANVSYIAAANPATVLALLDENNALRADARRYRHLRDEVWDFNGTDLWDTDSSQLDATLDAAIDRAAQSAVSAAEEK